MSILEVAAAEYHEDRVADTPTLSASIATILVNQSPAHAKAAHPKLNPYLVREDKTSFDLGTVVHALLLEERDPLDVIKIIEGYDDWKKPKAREERDYWREQGFVPMLAKNFDDVTAMVASAARQIVEHPAQPALLADGRPEVTLVWDEGEGVTCRSRLDWLRNDYAAIDDIKTSSSSADPEFFSRKTIYSFGYDVKSAMYLRGVKALTGVDAEFRWIVIETKPPYVVTVVSPMPDVLAHGQSKVERAIALWRKCLAEDRWPGYADRVCHAALPAWEETRWLEKAEREGFAA